MKAGEYPKYVRCKDNSLYPDLLTVGRVYECDGVNSWNNYRVAGKWFTVGRFTEASAAEWAKQNET